MIIRQYTVQATEGLHARPAKELTRLAKKYTSNLTMRKDGKDYDPRSLIGLVTAQATYLSTIEMTIDGEDEAALADALDHFFNEEVAAL